MHKENNKRRFPGESCKHRCDKAKQRREEARERQLKTEQLSYQERLFRLDAKFGVGKGAQKERARLLQLSRAKNPTPNDNTNTTVILSEEVMQEIATLNEENSGKKKMKAKERRERAQKTQ